MSGKAAWPVVKSGPPAMTGFPHELAEALHDGSRALLHREESGYQGRDDCDQCDRRNRDANNCVNGYVFGHDQVLLENRVGLHW
jgi:hypothetical protein